MEDMWSVMATEIALQPVPAEMARVVDILCNDCDEKCVNQRWHFLGVQCQSCSSFNTTVEKTIYFGQEAHDFLGPPTNIAEQAHLLPDMVDRNVFAALVGGEEVRSAGMNRGVLSDQFLAAEVMDIVQGASPRSPDTQDEVKD